MLENNSCEVCFANVAAFCFPGDVLISSGVIAYLGAFTAAFRKRCTQDWTQACKVNCEVCLSLLPKSFAFSSACYEQC